MKFLVVVAPPSIYHGCSTRKTFWEEKFTGKKQYLFVSLNMRNCGQRNIRQHREFKGSDERVTLNTNKILKILEEFENLDNMETTSSESKLKMERSGKGVGYLSGSQDQSKVAKNTKRQGIPSEMSV